MEYACTPIFDNWMDPFECVMAYMVKNDWEVVKS